MSFRLTDVASSVASKAPADITGAGISTAVPISVADCKKVTIQIICGAIGSAASGAVTLKQAQDSAKTGAKELAFTSYFTTSSTSDVPRDSETTVTSNTFNLTSSHANAILHIEVDAFDVDMANGFTHVYPVIADPGASAIVGVQIIGLIKREVEVSAL
jgi:flagellar capping protein FliD